MRRMKTSEGCEAAKTKAIEKCIPDGDRQMQQSIEDAMSASHPLEEVGRMSIVDAAAMI